MALTISLRTTLSLVRVYLQRTPSDFRHYAVALCWQMKQIDDTCWGGEISTYDHEVMANVLFNNFHLLIENLRSAVIDGRTRGLRIETDRDTSRVAIMPSKY